MGKLTLLGGLRGTKLELTVALGPLNEAPRELQRATRDIEPGSRGINFELGGDP